jgi:hypothetical protein
MTSIMQVINNPPEQLKYPPGDLPERDFAFMEAALKL